MLEIPSAVLVAPSFFDRIRFASLGTNDLLQYTLAADRGNPALERYRDPLHPALLRLIASAQKDAEAAGVELSVCGEMGGDPAAALALVGLGVTVLSMAASSLAPVRRAIRAADTGRAPRRRPGRPGRVLRSRRPCPLRGAAARGVGWGPVGRHRPTCA